MPKKSSLIKHILFGELKYIDYDGQAEPAIEDDRVGLTVAVSLNKAYSCNDFKIRITRGTEAILIDAVNADTKKLNTPKGKFLHFRLDDLACKEIYSYELLYKNNPLIINNKATPPADTQVFIRTPPARQDPQPIKIAVGGDQERHEQFNPIGACFGLDSQQYTQLLYQHIGITGTSNAMDAGIDEQPYHMVIHLGDLFNGEWFLSFSNLFRPDRKIVERNVQSIDAFRYHISDDFSKPVGTNLARVPGFYAVADDHDIGQNNAAPPTTQKQFDARNNMQNAFHEAVLSPQFLPQKKGPYYTKRIGQHEFFFLHNRYTQENNDEYHLLGKAQWNWLKLSLSESKASNKVLVTPLPLVMGKNPTEDYRGHGNEWHNLMQLCRTYKISTVLAGDSHNYSESEIHVRQSVDDAPFIVHQYLVGTLGGSAQHVTDDELKCINQPGHPPLMPKNGEFDPMLYQGSSVKAYFSPGDNNAFLPVSATDSQWTQPGEWSNGTFAYQQIICVPVSTDENPQDEDIRELSDGSFEQQVHLSPVKHAMPWQVRACLFTCNKKSDGVSHEPRLDSSYTTG